MQLDEEVQGVCRNRDAKIAAIKDVLQTLLNAKPCIPPNIGQQPVTQKNLLNRTESLDNAKHLVNLFNVEKQASLVAREIKEKYQVDQDTVHGKLLAHKEDIVSLQSKLDALNTEYTLLCSQLNENNQN